EQPWILALGGGGLGVGMAPCYWLPAIPEPIQWHDRPRPIPDQLSLGELFAPLQQVDPGPPLALPQFTLGIPIIAFTLASLPLLRRFNFHSLFLILGIGLTVLALVVFPGEVWLLGVISLCLSVAASAVVSWSKARPYLPILVIII